MADYNTLVYTEQGGDDCCDGGDARGAHCCIDEGGRP